MEVSYNQVRLDRADLRRWKLCQQTISMQWACYTQVRHAQICLEGNYVNKSDSSAIEVTAAVKSSPNLAELSL
jgi:hypothetical protein